MREDLKEALDRIKDMELEADKMADEAGRSARGIIGEAKEERSRIIERALEKARLDGQRLKAAMEEEAGKEAAAIEKRTAEDITALTRKAKDGFSKALEFVTKKIG